MLPLLVGALAGGGMGLLNQQAQKKRDYQDQMANAEMMRYSPWSGMQTSYKGATAPSMVGGIGQGALSGAMFGQQFGGGKPTIEATDNTWAQVPRTEKTAFYTSSRSPYAMP